MGTGEPDSSTNQDGAALSAERATVTGHQRALWITAILFLLGLFCLSYAVAHEAETGWRYPPECCGDGDCSLVHDATRIRTVDNGFLIDGRYFIAQRDTRLSPDGQWHVCIFSGKLYCVFRPDEGS